jgi:hypothetical protein
VSQEIKVPQAMMELLVLVAYRALLEYKDSQVPLATWVIQVPQVQLVYRAKSEPLEQVAYRAIRVPQVRQAYKDYKVRQVPADSQVPLVTWVIQVLQVLQGCKAK